MKSSCQCLEAYKSWRGSAEYWEWQSYKNKDMLNLHKTLVRGHLEFCVRSLRTATTLYSHDTRVQVYGVLCRLGKLGLLTLRQRRNRADLTEVFNIYSGLSILKFDTLFEVSSNSHTRDHNMKLAKFRCRLGLAFRRYFFAEWVIDIWYSLDQEAVVSPSINSFKVLDTNKKQKDGFLHGSFRLTQVWSSILLRSRSELLHSSDVVQTTSGKITRYTTFVCYDFVICCRISCDSQGSQRVYNAYHQCVSIFYVTGHFLRRTHVLQRLRCQYNCNCWLEHWRSSARKFAKRNKLVRKLSLKRSYTGWVKKVDPLRLSTIFPLGLSLLHKILYTYWQFISTYEYRFSFIYLNM